MSIFARVAAIGAVIASVLTFPAAAGPREDAMEVLKASTATVKKFLASENWTAVRNLMGGARAIVVFPDLIKGGFIVGGQSGSGILMTRVGDQWSDPVFLSFTTGSVGFQAGIAKIEALMMIMSDDGPKHMIDGMMSVGGTTTWALANLGVGAATGGGGKGINSITVEYSQGLFGGGSFEGGGTSLSTDRINAVYGPGTTAATITSGKAGTLPEAGELRRALSEATKKAWAG